MTEGERKAGNRRGYHHGDLRRSLLEAAECELAHKGLENFSLRGCAKRAGVSHAAPAHHFGDAGGLLAALAAEGFRKFVATVEARVAGIDPGDASGRLIAAGLGYIEFARAHPALFDLMFTSRRPDYDDEELTQSARKAFDQLVQAVTAVHGGPPLASAQGRRRVAATWAMAHGLASLFLAGRMTFLGDETGKIDEASLAAVLASVASD